MEHDTESLRLKKQYSAIWQLPEEFSYSIETLQNDLREALKRVPFNDVNQVCLTAPNDSEQDPYKYTGSFFSKHHGGFMIDETEFHYPIKIFEGLIFNKIYNDLKCYLPFKLGRMRLMNLKGRSCYSMHRDNGFRFHIALQTNPQCFLCFKESGAFQIPMNGRLYGTNTLLDHTALNGSFEDRIHLVINSVWDDKNGSAYLKNVLETI